MALRVRSSRAQSGQSWRDGLPVLQTDRVILRELQPSDAPRLLEIATCEQVTRFSWPAPDGAAAVERFIRWTYDERKAGKYLCYGIFSRANNTLAGMFELRRLQPDFFRAEAGFFVAPDFWGTGVFIDAAHQMMALAFDRLGVHRIEVRVAVDNDRGNAAMQKLAADREGVLRDAFVRDGQYVDQVMWSLRRRPWQASKNVGPRS